METCALKGYMQRNAHEDQASGLRELFSAVPPPVVHALSCPGRPALVLPLAQVLAHALVERGFTLAWIDEFDLTDRQEWPLPCPVRFDLSQSLMNHVPLASSLQALNPHLWYALSRRVSRVPSGVFPTLMQRLLDSGLNFDRVLLCLMPGMSRALNLYHDAIHHTVLTGCDPQELRQTQDWILRMQAQQPAKSWSVVLVGAEEKTAMARQWMADQLQPLLGQTIQCLGEVVADFPHGALSAAWSEPLTLRDLILKPLLQH